VALRGVGNTDTAIFHTLDGKLNAIVRNGAVDGIDLWYELRRAQALLKREQIPARTGSERTPFNTLMTTGTLDRGIMHNTDLRVETDYLKVRGGGTLHLDSQAIDYHVIVEVDKLPPSGAGAGLADLKAAEIPVLMTGSLRSPQVRPDLEALARGKLNEEVRDKLKKKLGDKLLELLGH
jgi:AsmA protein